MSYCVNCGVELEKGIAACPLCDTPVINPREGSIKSNEPPPYPRAVTIPKSVRKKYIVFLTTMALFIPSAVLAVADLLFIEGCWSVCVIASCALFWIWVIFPFMWRKVLPYVLLFIDSISLTAYLYLIYNLSSKTEGWFAAIAMPIVITLTVVAAIFIKWSKKRREWPSSVIAVLLAISGTSLIVDIAANLFYYEKLRVGVSPIIIACCFALIAFFAVVLKSRRFRAWVSRRFFV